MSHLRVVPVEPYGCYMPWRLRFMDGYPHSARCCFCNRDVAVPADAIGKNVACIYCGMERGFVPLQEIEPDTWRRDVP